MDINLLKKMHFFDDAVHVYTACMNLSKKNINKLNKILSENERKRAERFLFKHHKMRFIASHGFLRNILSKYLNIKPSLIRFNYSKKGKPRVSSIMNNANNTKIAFNMSHSENMALFGITKCSSVGIDIEYIRPIIDIDSLIKRFFTQNEYILINSLKKDEKLKKFFDIWTLKESYLKATGEGIAGLKNIEVSFDIKSSPHILYKNKPLSSDSWKFTSFTPASGYTAAISLNTHKESMT
jgi:4'-phosphopantetheinyl transferase